MHWHLQLLATFNLSLFTLRLFGNSSLISPVSSRTISWHLNCSSLCGATLYCREMQCALGGFLIWVGCWVDNIYICIICFEKFWLFWVLAVLHFADHRSTGHTNIIYGYEVNVKQYAWQLELITYREVSSKYLYVLSYIMKSGNPCSPCRIFYRLEFYVEMLKAAGLYELASAVVVLHVLVCVPVCNTV